MILAAEPRWPLSAFGSFRKTVLRSRQRGLPPLWILALEGNDSHEDARLVLSETGFRGRK